MVSISGIKLALEYMSEGDLEGVIDTLRDMDEIVGMEDVLHTRGKDEWEIIEDLSDYSEDDDEVILEDARDIWDTMFWLGEAGVQARLVAGSCGLCDEWHFWVACPKVQVYELLRRVRDGVIRNVDVPALRHLDCVQVETGPEKLVGRVENSAGGYYEHIERPITVIVSGRDDHNGVYSFIDSIFDAPHSVGGNSNQVRGLIPIRGDGE